MQTIQKTARPVNPKPMLTTVGALTVIGALIYWGGTAQPGPLFFIGVGVLLALLAALAGLIWYLYLSPLPEDQTIPASTSSLTARGLAGVLAVSSGLMFSVALIWDEVWHHRYGGFGNDFLWPPHFLLYGSLAILALFAVSGMLFLAWRGSGGPRERFRAEPLIGLLGLIALFQTAAAPSDLLWHKIYGVDLTAWSLPHLMLFGGVSFVLLCAVPLVLSSLPQTSWRRLGGLKLQEILALALLTFAGTLFVTLLAAEWQGIRKLPDFSSTSLWAFWLRPEWLLPVVLMSCAGFIGSVAAFVLKRIGVSSLVGGLMVAQRLVTIWIFGGAQENLNANAQLLLLPVFVALDLWLLVQRSRNPEPQWNVSGALVSSLAALVIMLPLITTLLIYPRVNASTLPMMLLMSVVMGLASTWAGSSLGAWLGTLGERPSAAIQTGRGSGWVSVAGALSALSLIALAIVTAKPPL